MRLGIFSKAKNESVVKGKEKKKIEKVCLQLEPEKKQIPKDALKEK